MFGDVGMNLSTTDEHEAVTTMAAPDGKASSAGARVAFRFFPSFTDIAFLTPLVLLFVGPLPPGMMLGDGDTGWHLRTGEWILANGRVPDRDIFSFTRAGQPWFAWEWLWDVTFAALHAHWGMAAVIFVSSLIIAATFALVYRLSLWRSGDPILAIAVTLAACFASSIHWLARPHLVTLLLIAVFYTLLERAQMGKSRTLVWLPLLTVLWTNLHGGFAAGIALVALYAAGEAVTGVAEAHSQARTEAFGRARRYLACAAACLAASLVNPYGYHLHAHVVRYLGNSQLTEIISEFQPLGFQHPVGGYIEAMIVVAAITAAWNAYHRRFTYTILLIGWTHLALVSARHVPLFLILAAPQVSACVADLMSRARRADVADWVRRLSQGFVRLGTEVAAVERIGRIPVLPVAAVAMLLLLLRAQAGAAFRTEYDSKTYPVRAAGMLRGQSGVLTTDYWGGYLIYRLYPDFRVFMDGRSDFYGLDFSKQYFRVMYGRHDWQAILDRYRVETVLLPVKQSLVGTLKESARWRPVYDDGMAILFRRSVPLPSAGEATPASEPFPAVTHSGLTAIVRSRTPQPVIRGSLSYARR